LVDCVQTPTADTRIFLPACCIPSVMDEVRYAGVDRAADLLRETGMRLVWTLKNSYLRIQLQLLREEIGDLL
jgi:hypothetical protein